jgi:threonine dehydrogenase-like Zn-dependent dehydrogenase
VLPEHLLAMPERMTPQDAVCYDPAQFALAGVRDSHLRAGDTVAVFGLGAIGQMTVQICRLAGAAWIAAVDPLAIRRGAAMRTGASVALDPTRADIPKALTAAAVAGLTW